MALIPSAGFADGKSIEDIKRSSVHFIHLIPILMREECGFVILVARKLFSEVRERRHSSYE